MSKNRITRKVPPDTLDRIRFNEAERKSLERLSRSRNLKDRRLCIDYLWAGVGVRNNRKLIFALCDRLLGEYFKEYFPKIQEIILGGNNRFARTLSMCFKFGDVLKPKNSKKYDEFIIAYCDETGLYKYLLERKIRESS